VLLAKNLLLSTKINNTAESSVDCPTNLTDKGGNRTFSANNENSASYSASSVQLTPSSQGFKQQLSSEEKSEIFQTMT
jgi:hypothetical protein